MKYYHGGKIFIHFSYEKRVFSFLYSPNKRGRSFFMHVKKEEEDDDDDVRKKERNVKSRAFKNNKKKNDSNTLRKEFNVHSFFATLCFVRKIAIP